MAPKPGWPCRRSIQHTVYPETSRDTDVMVLALRDVQRIGERKPACAQPTSRKGKKLWVGLFAQRIIARYRVVKWLTESTVEVGQGPSLRIGHRDKIKAAVQAPQCIDGVLERWPLAHGVAKPLSDRRRVGKTESLSQLMPHTDEIVGIPSRCTAGPRLAVRDKKILVRP